MGVALTAVLFGAMLAQGPGGGARDAVDGSWFLRRQLSEPWCLAGVRVIDVRSGAVLEGAQIVITGDQITSISTDFPPDGARVVEAPGKYVIPGLFDLHAHVLSPSPFYPDALTPEEALARLLDAGVTTIRLLPLFTEDAVSWAGRVQKGELLGPLIVPTGGVMERDPERTSFGFGDPRTAASWVERDALAGARWVKIYNSMDAESLAAIVSTANKHGMKVCGHAEGVPPLEAVRAGQATVEHAISFPLSCLGAHASSAGPQDLGELTAWRWEQSDPERVDELLTVMREHGAAWVPTLVVSEAMLESGAHDGRELAGGDLSERMRAALARAAGYAVRQHRAEGLIGIGTDFPIDGVEPGKSVHRELELLVELGGATPLEALQMATLSSADILDVDALLGAVEPGRLASFVVLDGNPLADVSNLRRVSLVVHAGRVHEPGAR
jgi:imidazolonepropionase-like amidohydrolase